MIFLLFTTAFVQAQETPQWFPEEGTQIDYAVTSYLTMLNGTESTETYFDVYAFGGSITLRPLHLRDLTGER